jgi:hypothetical protein
MSSIRYTAWQAMEVSILHLAYRFLIRHGTSITVSIVITLRIEENVKEVK